MLLTLSRVSRVPRVNLTHEQIELVVTHVTNLSLALGRPNGDS